LASSHTNFELIVVDDRSKDNTFEIARNYEFKDPRIKVYKNDKNIGDYPNRNMAASYAQGKYIKYVDCDDKISSNCLEIMVNAMEKHPTAALGLCKSIGDSIDLLTPIESYTNNVGILNYYGPTGSIMVREKYYEIGKFKELVTISDWDMWYRMAAKWDIVAFPNNLVLWRDHAENTLKSDSHKIGVLTNYMKAKVGILTSEDCPLSKQESKKRLKRENIGMFKYAVKTTLDKNSLKFMFIYFKYNWKYFLTYLFYCIILFSFY